jgi:hypothetical protein
MYLANLGKAMKDRIFSPNKFAEVQPPFWEFLDIEFDEVNKEFRFVAYYTQEPSFPELFKRMIGSPALRKVADELEQKGVDRIYKQSWKPRAELE